MKINVMGTERECKIDSYGDQNRLIVSEDIEKLHGKYEEAKDAEVNKIELELELLSSSAFG